MRLAFSSATSIAVFFADRALLLNPNLATAWVLSGLLRFYRGETDLAIEHLARGMRLSPLDPTQYQMHVGTGFAHLLAGRFDEASSWAEKALREEPDYLPAPAPLPDMVGTAKSRCRLRDPQGRLVG